MLSSTQQTAQTTAQKVTSDAYDQITYVDSDDNEVYVVLYKCTLFCPSYKK